MAGINEIQQQLHKILKQSESLEEELAIQREALAIQREEQARSNAEFKEFMKELFTGMNVQLMQLASLVRDSGNYGEGDTIQYCPENHPISDAFQVFEESPKTNTYINSNAWDGNYQENAQEIASSKQLDGFHRDKGILNLQQERQQAQQDKDNNTLNGLITGLSQQVLQLSTQFHSEGNQNSSQQPFGDPLAELIRLRQLGSVEQYQGNFDSLFTRLELPVSYGVCCFISGLKDEIQTVVRMFKPQTLHHAYCLAKLQEATLASIARKESSPSSLRTAPPHSMVSPFPSFGSVRSGPFKQASSGTSSVQSSSSIEEEEGYESKEEQLEEEMRKTEEREVIIKGKTMLPSLSALNAEKSTSSIQDNETSNAQQETKIAVQEEDLKLALQAYGVAVEAVCSGEKAGDICRTAVHHNEHHQGRAPEYLAMKESLLEVVRKSCPSGNAIASICHGLVFDPGGKMVSRLGSVRGAYCICVDSLKRIKVCDGTFSPSLLKEMSDVVSCFNERAQSMHVETFQSPWLCELMAFHINLREREKRRKPSKLFDGCYLKFTDGKPSLACELFDSVKLDIDTTCCICLDTVFDPVALICGHIFCYMCTCSAASVTIVDGLQGASPKEKCPLCREAAVFEGVVHLDDALSSGAIAEVKESVSSLDSEHILQTIEDILGARMSTASIVELPGDYQGPF